MLEKLEAIPDIIVQVHSLAANHHTIFNVPFNGFDSDILMIL